MNDFAKITPRQTDEVLASKLNGGAHFVPSWMGPQVQRDDPLRPRKVAILGTAPSSRMLAPFDDPTWTIWGSSPANGMGQLRRVDAWFEMHCNLLWPEYRSYGEPYLKWLNEQHFPVVAQDATLIPRAIPYPIDHIIGQFGRYFFTSTFAWMMAYAIDVGVQEMALYGIDMSSKDEYILQRPGGHYFITLARQRGINVIIPQESDLAQPPPLYGYADGTAFGRKIAAREQELKGRIAQLEAEQNRNAQSLTYLKGALEDLDYIRSIWGSVDFQQAAPDLPPVVVSAVEEVQAQEIEPAIVARKLKKNGKSHDRHV